MALPDDVVVRCDNLVQLYDTPTVRVQAVRGIDLTVTAGSTVAIVGPSGCGKSSLLRMLAGIDRPAAGSVCIAGVELTRLGNRARARIRASTLTYVFPRPGDNLVDHLSVRQQLERVTPRRRRRSGDVDDILHRLQLAARGDESPAYLSGGERQRLAFGRAMAAGHRVVISDEPTAHLDSESASLLLDAMAALAASGATLVVATHDARVLDRVDQVVALRDGAVATVTERGTELAVVDRSGRVQLPPAARELFADHRARMTVDHDTGTVTLEQP